MARPKRLDLMTVYRNQAALQRAGVDPIGRGRRGVDDAQPQLATRVNRDHIGVGEGAVVGQIGVEIKVVEVHRHAPHRHTAHRAALVRHGGHIHAAHRGAVV
jgi:hypothetical protein